MNDVIRSTPLIPFDVVNRNNRKYTKECIKNLPKTVPIVREMKGIEELTPENIVGSANLTEEKDGIFLLDVTITDANYAVLLQEMMNKGGRFVPAGFGTVGDDGIIQDFELREVCFTMDPAW